MPASFCVHNHRVLSIMHNGTMDKKKHKIKENGD